MSVLQRQTHAAALGNALLLTLLPPDAGRRNLMASARTLVRGGARHTETWER